MHDEIRPHIDQIARDSGRDQDALADRLVRGCWPAGPADRVERAALEWVRRWSPRRGSVTALPPCTCPAARCAVCN